MTDTMRPQSAIADELRELANLIDSHKVMCESVVEQLEGTRRIRFNVIYTGWVEGIGGAAVRMNTLGG